MRIHQIVDLFYQGGGRHRRPAQCEQNKLQPIFETHFSPEKARPFFLDRGGYQVHALPPLLINRPLDGLGRPHWGGPRWGAPTHF